MAGGIFIPNFTVAMSQRKGDREMSECKREMRLDNTDEMMSSLDYKERFKAEYCQAMIRYRKLKAMLDKWEHGMLDLNIRAGGSQ